LNFGVLVVTDTVLVHVVVVITIKVLAVDFIIAKQLA
jgi:hypothetical protein